jgi:DNA-binding NtrC family response regulator
MEPKKCVLIVDDEPNVRLVLRAALESVGYEVIEAESGPAALEQLVSAKQGVPCDLILLDLQMPKMGGIELLSRLRAARIAVPVVILTAHGSIPEAVAAMKLGAIDFLTKPITPEALRRVVAEVIGRHAATRPAGPSSEASAAPADRPASVAFDLARAKRAINRGELFEAERLLAKLSAAAPDLTEAAELLSRLQTLKQQEEQDSFRILRDWFPSGAPRRKP